MEQYTTMAENTWCPGCGNFGIFNAVKQALRQFAERNQGIDHLFITTGIGCHGKIFDYLTVSGFYALHGRSMSVAQGVKLANPELKVLTFAGDGDAFGEGLEHMIFAAKRNADITVLVHDNGVYGLTVGQVTPVSASGQRGPSTPHGSIEPPLNPLALLLEAGASFVARSYSREGNLLANTIVEAIEHKGFSFIDILQPCVSFNNTWQKYNSLVETLAQPAATRDEAIAISKRSDKLPIGIIYKEELLPFHERLYGKRRPLRDRLSRQERLDKIKGVLA